MKLSVKEVCIKLKKTERTVYKWLKEGKLKGEKVEGKWIITIHNVEKEEKQKEENGVLEKLDQLEEKVNDLKKQIEEKEQENELLKQKIKRIEENLVEGKEQKKREFEILSRIVKSQLQLKQKNEDSRVQNKFLQISVRKVLSKFEEFKSAQKMLQIREKPMLQESMASSVGDKSYNFSHKNADSKGKIKSEERAERWVRNNIPKWYYQPCGFGQLSKYSFEEIALNKASKAKIKGKEQPSRAYLHVIAKDGCTWGKIKAVVALEITANQKETYSKAYNHYTHPNEIGG